MRCRVYLRIMPKMFLQVPGLDPGCVAEILESEMTKLPKTLIIGGVKWRIFQDSKITGGAFRWYDHTITIRRGHSPDRQFQTLIHEIVEVILVNNTMRYSKCFASDIGNGDYLFAFDHDRFEIFTDELAGVLKQFMEVK
jgi:hypothetical protein